MIKLDEHILYELSPHYYPKPKKEDPLSLKPKTKKQIIEENDNNFLNRRKSKLDVYKKINFLDKHPKIF